MANDRITQVPVEVVVAPTDTKARTSQAPVEVVVLPTSAKARTSQEPVEVVVKPTNAKARLSHLVVEVLIAAPATATETGSFTANAVLRRTISASFTADAVIGPSPPSFTIDSWIREGRAFGVWAVITSARTGSFTADAVLTRNFTANAVLRTTVAASFTVGAWIYAPRTDPGGPGEPGETPLVSILVDGEDVTHDVILSDATFTMLVNGAVGSFRFRVRDDDHTRSFVSGSEVTLDIDGKRKFGGFLMLPKRMFAFPVEDTTVPGRPSRFHVLEGVDYNILLTKRVVYDADDPASVGLRSWPAGSHDDVVIRYTFDNYTDLGADGVTHQGVTHVGSPNPDLPGVIASGGHRFVDAMREINRLIGGVFYIDPFKDFNFVDVDTADATIGLSDHPGDGEVGYRELEQTENGTRLVNETFLWGAGLGSRVMVFSHVEDEASILAHGRWQSGEFTTALYRQESVDDRANSIVYGTPQNKRGGKDDQESWSLVSYESSFTLGQKVAVESEVFGKADVLPIRRMTITFPSKKKPKLHMVLSHEIDEPWNLFEFPPFPGFPSPGFPGIEFPSIELPPETCYLDTDLIWNVTPGGTASCGTTADNNICIAGSAYLYNGSVYRADFSVSHQGATGGVVASAVRLAPFNAHACSCYMGSGAHGDAITHATCYLLASSYAPDPGAYYGIEMYQNVAGSPGAWPIVSGIVTFSYVSGGTDPRFQGIERCGESELPVGDGRPETFIGDGSTTVYELSSPYVFGSTMVFVNGFFQRPGIEYTESSPLDGEITFTVAPADEATIVVMFTLFVGS